MSTTTASASDSTRRLQAALGVLAVAAAAATPFVVGAPSVLGRIALNHNEVVGRDRAA